ncbi:hypothetical protein [Nocardia sp. NBC_01388]|uniref:hypothetical protein n=1 Tax=Nocardia sp. NBC_01388 TaxID=2903596 RepID=UPI0032431BA7
MTAAAFAALLLAGCSDDHQSATPYQLPDNVQFSYRWTATPGLDLESDPAIVTRATIESAFIATVTRTTDKSDIAKYTYPGYIRAADPAVRSKEPNLYTLWDAGTFDTWVPVHGTAYAYLVSLQKSSGDPSARAMDALACVWLNGLSVSFQTPNYRSLMDPALVPQAVTLKLRAPQDDTSKLTALGHGPARYPTADVFGQWSVESITVNSSRIQAVPYQDPCAGLPNNPVPLELLNTTSLTYYPKHLPTLDPDPGWAATTVEPPKP